MNFSKFLYFFDTNVALNSLHKHLQTSIQQMIDQIYNSVVSFFNNPYTHPMAIVLAALSVGGFLRWAGGRWLAHLAKKTETFRDDIIIEALRRTVLYIVLLIGINIAVRDLPSSMRLAIMPYARPSINTGFIILLTFLIAQILRQIFKARAANEYSRVAAVSLTRKIVEIVIYSVGAVMVLRTFGVDVTAIITALGVGGLAVALALQDTLANAFAGMYITLAKQIRVGDYIKTNDGFEGFVRDIGWRNTTMQMLELNTVLIPNNKLAQAIVTNYFLPKETLYVRATVGVSYQTDPQKVEDILRNIIEECGHATPEEAAPKEQPNGKIHGLLHTPEPLVRFQAFGDYTLNFSIMFVVNTFDSQFSVRHEVMKQIYYRFRAAGITIPMPIRTLHLDGSFGEGFEGNGGNAITSAVSRKP